MTAAFEYPWRAWPEYCVDCETRIVVSSEDCKLIDAALGVLTSDYNDVDHDAIAKLRDRIALVLRDR